jgi:hypothetical protein
MHAGWFVTPVIFGVVFAVALILLRLLKAASLPVKTPHGSGKGKAYACGEDVKDHRIEVDYRQFFPFAFFFTLMHVLALVVATVPAGSLSAAAVAGMYSVSLIVGLWVLFRR